MIETSLKIILAQLNFLVGDIHGNTEKIIIHAIRARDEFKADIIAFPELTLTAYPPEDLILRQSLHAQVEAALEKIKTTATGITIILGHPKRTPDGIYNAASVIRDGKIIADYYKEYLPNYSVFDEKRYFIPGIKPTVITINNIKIGITICEDMWWPQPMIALKNRGADCVISLNASPYRIKKSEERIKTVRVRVKETGLPVLYINHIGGQDELVFDGGSFVMDSHGSLPVQGNYFAEQLIPVEIKKNQSVLITNKLAPKILSPLENIYQALILGTKDYVRKSGFKGALIGLSGGIDSALTLTIAVDALGHENVKAILMPSRYTAKMSIEDATSLAYALGVSTSTISIEKSFKAFLASLKDEFKGQHADVTEENIQARCRGVILMAISNKTKRMVLTTGNKSEMSVGYATLYGDMAGGYAVIKDVYKTLVYQLANYRNSISPVIPQRIITRAPSAELAKNQLDEDSLPPYAILDPILEMYIEKELGLQDILAKGHDEKTVRNIISLVDRNEYKRRQAPPGVRITTKAFGKDRRYPIVSGFKTTLDN